MSDRRIAVAAALDAAAIVLFAAIGVRNHDIDSGFGDVFTIAAPFLIGLAVGWLAARAWDDPFSLRTGAIAWMATIVVGMLLRNLVFDRGTATSFVIVTTLFVGAFLLAWRLLARLVTRRRRRSARLGPTSGWTVSQNSDQSAGDGGSAIRGGW